MTAAADKRNGGCVWVFGGHEAQHANWVMMNKCNGKCDTPCDGVCGLCSFHSVVTWGSEVASSQRARVMMTCVMVAAHTWTCGGDSKRGGCERLALRMILVVWFRFSYFEEVP